ncbi:hypothetical protein IEQ34_013086 [Dendrobium chrysotoxum]|uniref:Uncharacterized protein n=1 Tax=Dendrobium chrysotoxum TaxID=161865 RepID=A0AAV7GMH0_DENCH|nr:hypothetical protein IEQ34_013086 [Dendrobium chrysotoxum]
MKRFDDETSGSSYSRKKSMFGFAKFRRMGHGIIVDLRFTNFNRNAHKLTKTPTLYIKVDLWLQIGESFEASRSPAPPPMNLRRLSSDHCSAADRHQTSTRLSITARLPPDCCWTSTRLSSGHFPATDCRRTST